MDSRNESAYMDMVFARDSSVSRQEKVKALWKFLDARGDLQPHRGTSELGTPSTKSSVSCVDETSDEKDVWRKGLEIFQRLGLDKTALTTNRCKLCLVERTIRCKDLADTVAQPYEELSADMKAFQQRQKSRNLYQKATLASD